MYLIMRTFAHLYETCIVMLVMEEVQRKKFNALLW
jgi:hypothetical protein